MPGQRPLLAMSFIASLGITFEVLACSPSTNREPHLWNFWPLLVWVIYLLLLIPLKICRNMKDTMMGFNETAIRKARDVALFFFAGVIVSSFALPIVLARTPLENPRIPPVSCILVEIGNALCLATMGLFCVYFKPSPGF